MNAPRTFAYWRHLADCNILHRITDNMSERAELLDRIAGKCCEIEERGEVASVWHALALVTGQRCSCAKCNPTRRLR